MKVAFDQHVPTAFANPFIQLAKANAIRETCSGLEFVKAQDYAPKINDRDFIKKSDVPWLDRFAAAGGRAVISGDVRMRERTHELLTLYHHKFIVIFFERQWGNWNFFRKSALLLHWWEEVTAKIKTAERGTFWVVPSAWPHTPSVPGELRNVSLGLASLLKDRPKVEVAPKPARPRKRTSSPRPSPRNDGRQHNLLSRETDDGSDKKSG